MMDDLLGNIHYNVNNARNSSQEDAVMRAQEAIAKSRRHFIGAMQT